jgi:hypothetical protein
VQQRMQEPRAFLPSRGASVAFHPQRQWHANGSQ